ncbi:DNA adenine methylase [Thauera butanivorans]|uniref:DNA adenine methylase n=1 Tax=Thauera butanivorans TaxID=86174 RepID=UPI003AB87951
MPTHGPIIPWIGGKRRLARHILPLFPEHTCYVEPFAGAAALFFMKAPVKAEVLNDINSDLVNLYRVVQHHLDEFIRQFSWSLTSRQMFEWARDQAPGALTDIQRAARFYYLQRLGFGGKVEGRTFGTATTAGPRLTLARLQADLAAAHVRLARATIEHLEWHKCIQRYDRPHTLFYCDPPYWGTEGYGVAFGLEQYTRLADLARSIRGKMLISVNDIPEMRAAFTGLAMQTVALRYTVGGNRPDSKPTQELLIRNW